MPTYDDLIRHLASRVGERIPKTAATALGLSVLGAPDAATARSRIGAGTSSLTVGTTAGTAKDGAWKPTAADVTDATTVGRNVLKATDAAAARTAIGAGTVKTVNGAAPDAAGNVAIETGSAGGVGATPIAGEPGLYTIGA